ncbi:MAG: hypothetical protein ACYDD0_12295 [Candidatus Dormibacteria bacterium]
MGTYAYGGCRCPECKEAARAWRAAYYASHREQELAWQAAYYVSHRERRRAYMAAYYVMHREELRAVHAAYRARRKAATERERFVPVPPEATHVR